MGKNTVKNSKLRIAAALIAIFFFGGIMGLGLSTFLSPYLFSPPSQEEIQKHMLSFLSETG